MSKEEHDVYLILGAGSDVGSALIQRILKSDCNARILAQYKTHKPLTHPQITPLYCDLASMPCLENLIQELRSQPLANKIIHLASPKVEQKPFRKLEWEGFMEHIEVGLRSIFYVLKEILPKLNKQKTISKKVLFMLSSYVYGKPPLGMSEYVSIKYALLGFLKSLASEYKNIQFNAISPCMMETKFLDNLDSRILELSAQNHPRGRNAKISDILEAMEFLLGEGSEFMTGGNLNLSGGEVF